MKKEDLVVGHTYKINGGLPWGHSFTNGEEVTYHKDDGSNSPVFKSVKTGVTQYVLVDWISQVAPQKPVEVKVGDKVRIINEGSNSSNGTYYRVGHEGVVTHVHKHSINVDLSGYGLPLNKPAVDVGDFEVIQDSLTVLKTAYDNAKTAYETAVRAEQEAIKAAEAKAKEALKFTEADVKNFMVVEFFPSDLRLVVIHGDRVNFLNNAGVSINECSRASLLKDLNTYYKKTTKTLKDFAND